MSATRIALIALLSFGAAVGAQTAEAEEHAPVVLELFTSQGCSSCPGADALLRTYADRKDVVALSMPVDYWDYLGWKDTLANPKFSRRQRDYAKSRGDGQVYTPQLVVNGRSHVNGASRAAVEDALNGIVGSNGVGKIKARLAHGTITIDVPPVNGEPTIWLAVIQPSAEVTVRSGENRGRKLAYFNVVRELVPLGMAGAAATEVKQQTAVLTSGDGLRYAVLIQDGIGGPIVSAAWVESPR